MKDESNLPVAQQSLVYRLRKRAEIRRQISTRKSVQEGKSDRLADLLDEAAAEIEHLIVCLKSIMHQASNQPISNKYIMPNKILVIDDTEINRLYFTLCLQDQYDIIEASSGEAGYRLAVSEQPNLILLDIMMPGVDGFDTARMLKGDPRTATIPIIFVTAMTDSEYRKQGMSLGAVDYMVRPFSGSMLQARIGQFVS